MRYWITHRTRIRPLREGKGELTFPHGSLPTDNFLIVVQWAGLHLSRAGRQRQGTREEGTVQRGTRKVSTRASWESLTKAGLHETYTSVAVIRFVSNRNTRSQAAWRYIGSLTQSEQRQLISTLGINLKQRKGFTLGAKQHPRIRITLHPHWQSLKPSSNKIQTAHRIWRMRLAMLEGPEKKTFCLPQICPSKI